jgi:hypothetical protein
MKTRQTHTPGPWYIAKQDSIIHIQSAAINEDNYVCGINFNEINAIANAHLIASAPELLFYLKDLIEQVEQFPRIAKGINMTYAKNAIKRAEGK